MYASSVLDKGLLAIILLNSTIKLSFLIKSESFLNDVLSCLPALNKAFIYKLFNFCICNSNSKSSGDFLSAITFNALSSFNNLVNLSKLPFISSLIGTKTEFNSFNISKLNLSSVVHFGSNVLFNSLSDDSLNSAIN